MLKFDRKKAALLTLVLLGSAPLIGCEKDNSAGGVGKKLDNAVDPRGPAQKVGDKLDGIAK
jgi:predicted small secreted protein